MFLKTDVYSVFSEDFFVRIKALKMWLKGCKSVAKSSSTKINFHHTCSLKNQLLFENLILDLLFALGSRRFSKGEGWHKSK